MPQSLGDIYAFVTWLGQRASEAGVESASATLLERLTPEFAVLLAKEMITANPRFVAEPAYKRFVKAHGSLLVG